MQCNANGRHSVGWPPCQPVLCVPFGRRLAAALRSRQQRLPARLPATPGAWCSCTSSCRRRLAAAVAARCSAASIPGILPRGCRAYSGKQRAAQRHRYRPYTSLSDLNSGDPFLRFAKLQQSMSCVGAVHVLQQGGLYLSSPGIVTSAQCRPHQHKHCYKPHCCFHCVIIADMTCQQ